MYRVLRGVRRRIWPGRRGPLILMYHRIAQPRVDPWGLAVRPDRFEAQLAVLRRSRQPLSMSELVDRLERGVLPRNAVALTFDDGYADTLREAKPRLAAAAVPATLFLATGFVGQPTEYWWDELARGILTRTDALDCEVTIGGEPHRLRFEADDGVHHAPAWRAWNAPRTGREAAYLSAWRRLRELPARDRDAAMGRVRDVLGAPAPAKGSIPMSASEVTELVADGLVDVGGHTATHPVLPTLDPAERRREILEGKHACERLIDRAVTGFAYPHGANDPDTRAAVHECGFKWACSTESRPVPMSDLDWFALPRMAVLDWDGPAFERALQAACA